MARIASDIVNLLCVSEACIRKVLARPAVRCALCLRRQKHAQHAFVCCSGMSRPLHLGAVLGTLWDKPYNSQARNFAFVLDGHNQL